MAPLKLQDIFIKIKQLLQSINYFKTIRLGMEQGISSKDVPFARVMPGSIQDNDSKSATLPFIVYIGIKNSNDLEAKYAEVFDAITQVTNALFLQEVHSGLIKSGDVNFDDDRVQNFKVTELHFKLEEFYVD